jgi:hypothetical protein
MDQMDLFAISPVAGVPTEVVKLFEEYSLRVWRQGWRQYSADAILHRLRWHMHIERGDRDFKCNNNWTSQLARWFLKTHPECGEFFETRALASERCAGQAPPDR